MKGLLLVEVCQWRNHFCRHLGPSLTENLWELVCHHAHVSSEEQHGNHSLDLLLVLGVILNPATGIHFVAFDL